MIPYSTVDLDTWDFVDCLEVTVVFSALFCYFFGIDPGTSKFLLTLLQLHPWTKDQFAAAFSLFEKIMLLKGM